jgi:phosphatidate phosphatase PAH1
MPPLHFMQDRIALPGARVDVVGKFSYGDFGKDLEDEPVRLYLGSCDAWSEVASARTDDDGRAHAWLEVPRESGLFGLRFSVDGDASSAGAKLVVAPSGTKVVVFDIDGTLTVHDREINREVVDDYYEDLYEGDYVPQGWPGGPELTRAWADKGYLLLYVTGRPYWLLDKSRAWLDDRGYAPGIVHTTDRHRDVVPSIDGVGEFKRDFFRMVVALGWTIEVAYGNAATDIWAYDEAGIAKDRTFIIGPHAGAEGTQAIAPDYTSHLAWVAKHADAEQPFARAR